ncbi:hypothetical protein RirG_239880 [Rhizophagus irregularis DAOM 197198w]|uniref:Reverse transcriptase domain-containing protein n=1 Tax=Rhizophagus irregularis (strain DAOM 197198w) TaxID=1432141 RepID=A0A015LG84_RHIIW|nr:hypothetical protein RirG_239880 [Rhizophagus irregularis DAOM 197198w]
MSDACGRCILQRCADLADNQRRMIDNITENEMIKIFIDRVLIDDEDGNSILVTDENKIKDITKDHFQNAVGSKNRTIDDLLEWSDEYEPIRSINELIYNNCLEPITDGEWDIVIKDLPIKKAVGPTGIAYDEIKKALSEFNHLLRDIINEVLRTQIMPEDWKLANIYPIPKLKPWGYRLNNTRPITLLETARKVMMKIITKRISKIIVEHQILQGYQYAGLPLNSTFEPLRIINEIIQHSNEHDKELWIFALDMSKAYDRINVFMLEKAMKRIKFPVELINLLTGYDIDGVKVNNIYENVEEKINFNFSGLAYMDDTNFMAGNQENLEKILSIADTFYNLNDIKINKDKSELLLRKKYIPESLFLSFRKLIVNIKPASKKGSIRLLGVWFNAFNRRNHVIDQIKNEINNCCNSMILRKKLTDKQMAFIFNVLIIPRIEYRAQLIILSEHECNKIMAKFRILFKHKLKFMKTTPNSIVHLKEMFNVKNIEDNQLQAKTTNFILQINDKNELGMITKIRLYNLQQLLFLNDNPIYSLR